MTLKADERTDYLDCPTYREEGVVECDGQDDFCGWCPKYNDPVKNASDGHKYDHGKTDMSFLDYFPLALEAVCKVSQFGGDKGYIRGSFDEVPDARKRYTAAMLRHYLAEGSIEGEPSIDPESGLPHDFAVAWNALCRLELRLRNLQ